MGPFMSDSSIGYWRGTAARCWKPLCQPPIISLQLGNLTCQAAMHPPVSDGKGLSLRPSSSEACTSQTSVRAAL